MKALLVLLALAACEMASAQKAPAPRSAETVYYLDTVKAEVYHTRFLLPQQYRTDDLAAGAAKFFPLLNQPGITLQQVTVNESPVGEHIFLQPLYNGIPVFHSEVRMHIDQQQQVYLLSAVLFPVQGTAVQNNFTAQAAAWCREWYGTEPQDVKQVVYYDGHRAQNAVRFHFRSSRYPRRPEIVVSENGQILYQQNLVVAFTSDPDTTVSGYVYEPDPLTTAQKFYGRPYIDSFDFSNPSLDSQRVMVRFKASFINDSFHLQTPLFKMADFTGIAVAPVVRTDTLFAYNRGQSGFEDVNVFYHVNNFYDYITSTFGYDGLFDTLLIDSHGKTDDNSFFDPEVLPTTLEFGIGGVDDGEDADVVVHELTHAMSHNGSPASNFGIDRRAMEEGMGDYSAASYSKSYSAFRYNEIYTWDGHNEYWDGRITNSTKQYIYDQNGDVYNDCLIWSASLMEINDALGRTEADRIMYLSLFMQGSNMTMPQMALIILRCDSLLNDAANYLDIKRAFVNHNILHWSLSTDPAVMKAKDIQLVNSQAFAYGSGEAYIKLPLPVNINLAIYDMQGRKIWDENAVNTSQVSIPPNVVASGMYILQVQVGELQQSFRLLRLAD